MRGAIARLQSRPRPRVAGAALFVVAAAFVLAADVPILSMPGELGSDFGWYRDGVDRIASGYPLYDERMLNGPFDFLALPPMWNQAPWALALVFPFAALEHGVAQLAWLAATVAALLIGLALVWPVRLAPATQLLLATLLGISAPILMGLAWGNLQAVTVLGLGLFWYARSRGSRAGMIVGVALAAAKVIPAIPPIVLLVRDRDLRTIGGAAAVIAVLTAPVIVLASPLAPVEFFRVSVDMLALPTHYNVSMAVLLSPFMDPGVASWLLRAAAVALFLVALRLRDDRAAWLLSSGACLLVLPNLYGTWFLVPIVAFLAWLPGSRLGQALDAAWAPLLRHRRDPSDTGL